MNSDRTSAIDLLEAAVDLLRLAPARAWATYLVGATPFWGVFLIFWSRMTGTTEAPDPLYGAIILAILFGIRQYTRALFVRLLYEEMAGERTKAYEFRAFAIAWLTGIVRLPLLILPASAVIAFFRTMPLTGNFGRAAALARKGGDQTAALLAMIPLAILVWINVFTGMIALPALFQILTGQQTILTRNVSALMNGATMISSLVVTWTLMDILLAAFYTVRVYYGESEDTGADLLVRWRAAARKIAPVILITLFSGHMALADADLNRALDRVLAEKPYQWRKHAPASEGENAFVTWTGKLQSSIARQWERFKAWLRNREPGTTKRPGAPPPVFSLRVISWLTIVVLAGVLAALLLRSQRSRQKALATAASSAVAAGPVNLDDPALLASMMPDSEWLALAQDYFAKGDYRMALRAYFLANLSYLGARELLVVGRSKSNFDYLAELRRRGRLLSGLEALFAANIRSFENAWYGLHPVAAGDVNLFAGNLERIRELAR